MIKVPFCQVEIELNKLYDFDLKTEIEINERCELIAVFVEACGWTPEEYVSAMIGMNRVN